MMNRIFTLLFLLSTFAFPKENVIFIKVAEQSKQLPKGSGQSTGFAGVDRVLSQYHIQNVSIMFPEIADNDIHLGNWKKCVFPENTNIDALLINLQNDPDVLFAQSNHVFHIEFTPNDPYLSDQWALTKIKAFEAWNIERGNAAVPVAVIDTGVDYNNQDISGNIWVNPGEDINRNGIAEESDYNGIDDDRNGFVDDLIGWDFTDAPNYPDGGDYLGADNDPMDERGHGTGVAGIIAAVTDNQYGIAGIAHNCRIMNVRAFTTGGNGEEDDVASAILYAVRNGARIINMSWGDVFVTRLMDDVVQYAASQNVIMVASAGNSSTDQIHYPSGFAGTISVAATDQNDQLAGFSNYGSGVDIAAPGVDIETIDLKNNFSKMSGTSFSAPFVSAAAALLLSRDITLSAENVKGLLCSTADAPGDRNDNRFGAGRLNLLRLLESPLYTIVSIDVPKLDQGFSKSSVEISGSAWGPNFKSFTLAWGEGENPINWMEIIHSDIPVLDGYLGVWTDLPQDGEYTIRLSVENNDATFAQDFVRIFLDSSAPTISNIQFLPMLNGDYHSVLVQFQTDDLCEGSVFYRAAGSNTPFQEAVLAYRTTLLRYNFSQPEFSGVLELKVQARNGAGLTSINDNNGQLYNINLSADPLNVTNFVQTDKSAPYGYLLNKVFDFNQNGFPELIISPIDNGAIGRPGFYEWDGSVYQKADELPLNLIPRDLADTNRDGIPELLCGFAGSSYLYETVNTHGFPVELGNEWIDGQDQYWAARIADVNNDGISEIILRFVESEGDKKDAYEIWEKSADGSYHAVYQITNPTSGDNMNGVPHAEIGDFDGDGKTDILLGDSDGDLYIWEFNGNDNFHAVWQDSLPLLDSIDFIKAGDFDGDGIDEFIAGCHSDPNLNTEHYYDARHWYYRVYDRSGDNQYIQTAEWRFWGFESVSDFPSSVNSGDVDNDNLDEIIITAFPDLYIIDYDPADSYKIVYHCGNIKSSGAIVADTDLDGVNEIWVGDGTSSIAFIKAGSNSSPATPAGFQAQPVDEYSVNLNWRNVPGADYYIIYRGESVDRLTPLTQIDETAYIDTNIISGTSYYYAITAVDLSNQPTTSLMTMTVSATPGPRPFLDKAVMESTSSIRLLFSAPMNKSAGNASNYQVTGFGRPSSAVIDASGSQVVLSLNQPFTNAGVCSVSCLNLGNINNVPIDTTRNRAEFVVEFAPMPPYLVNGRLAGKNTIQLIFNTDMDMTTVTEPSNYVLSENLEIESIHFDQTLPEQVELKINSKTPVGALGKSYIVLVKNVKNAQGILIEKGRGDFLQLDVSKSNLDHVIVFPNPYHPGYAFEHVTFGNLTAQAEIRIFTTMGLPVRTVFEKNGDGGAIWDLKDDQGNLVTSGIYIFQVQNNGQKVMGKLAVIR